MSGQLTLWATGPMARLSDPASSQVAAPSPQRISELQAQVLAEYRAVANWQNGGGLTHEEVATRFPNRCIGTTKKRATELAHAGLLQDSGVRRPTATGRDAIVWTAGDARSL